MSIVNNLGLSVNYFESSLKRNKGNESFRKLTKFIYSEGVYPGSTWLSRMVALKLSFHFEVCLAFCYVVSILS